MIHVEVKRELIADNGKKFELFDDIAFSIHNSETNHIDRVIARIIGMSEPEYNRDNGYIVVDKVEINRCNESNQCIFHFKDMTDINYVFDGAY